MVLKSCVLCVSVFDEGDCSVLTIYRWKRSVPALSAIGLRTEDLRIEEWWERRERDSDVVDGGECRRSEMREEIAARGIVRVGWEWRRWV